MEIYKDGKETATVEKELKELAEIKQRAEDHYNNLIHFISTHDDNTEKQTARVMIITVGKILGYSDTEIETDIKEAYGFEW